MKLSFIGILLRPLKLNNLLSFAFNSFLLFLPSILAAHFLGNENIFFKIAVAIALIIINGYLFTLFQNDIENEDNDLPKWQFVNNFFLGLKVIIFYLGCLAVFGILILALWFATKYFEEFHNIAQIIAIFLAVFWILFYIPVAMGLFSEKFNPLESLKFFTILEIIKGSWKKYLKAGIQMLIYLVIISVMCWSFIMTLGIGSSNHITGLFTIYAIIVYYSLYAKTFVLSRSEFESYF